MMKSRITAINVSNVEIGQNDLSKKANTRSTNSAKTTTVAKHFFPQQDQTQSVSP